jgi:Family of unknown function (DUF5715)
MRLFACTALWVFLFPVWMWAAAHNLAAADDSLVADDSSQAVQNARADADNLSRMRNVRMVRRFAAQGYLVSVPPNTHFYYLHSVPPAYRYCRPWTKLFLRRLSRQYYARFHQRLRVTSLVRTVASQERLARRNGNAADAVGSARSSHLTGATVDISKRWMSPAAQDWMRAVLYSLRRQGHVYAVEEFEQPTFHVMVYKSYPEHVKRLTVMARKRERKRAPKQEAAASAAEKEPDRSSAGVSSEKSN